MLSSQQQEGREPNSSETNFSGRMPQPRASHRFPNFRNQAGICLTKINLVPNIYFCHYFRVMWRGRSTQAGDILHAAHRGHFLGWPLGWTSSSPEQATIIQSGGRSRWHHIQSLEIGHFWISKSSVSSLTWANNPKIMEQQPTRERSAWWAQRNLFLPYKQDMQSFPLRRPNSEPALL